MFIEDQERQKMNPKNQMDVDQFFFIPEEVHILSKSFSIRVQNNSIIGVNTWLNPEESSVSVK
jgi:DNA-directed RNA polymerase subunit beta'